MSNAITFNGKTQTIAAWARELAISAGTLYARLERGVPVERIFAKDYVPQTRSGARVLMLESRTQSLAAWARELSVPRGRIEGRLYRGWSVVDALTRRTPPPELAGDR